MLLARQRRPVPPPQEPLGIVVAFARDLERVFTRFDQVIIEEVFEDPELRAVTAEVLAERGLAAVRVADSLDRVSDDAITLRILERSRRSTHDRLDAVEQYPSGGGDSLVSRLEKARVRIQEDQPDEVLIDLLQRHGRDVNVFNLRQVRRQFKAALGIDVIGTLPHGDTIFKQYVADNVALIRGFAQQKLRRVEETVRRHWRVGDRWEEIADKLHQELGVNKKRAMLIARDQVGKLNGELARDRQTALGVQQFVWRTSLDGRVRDQHRALEGKIFDYAKGGHPTEKIPGWPIRCRCYAEPVFEGLEGPEGPMGGPTDQTPFPSHIGRAHGVSRSSQKSKSTSTKRAKEAEEKLRKKAEAAEERIRERERKAAEKRAEATRKRAEEKARKAAEREAARKAEEERRRAEAEAAKRAAEERERQRRRAEAIAFARRHGLRPDVELDTSAMRKVGGQAGSNAGGLYEDQDGQRWYIKTPAEEDQARNEVLAGKLYELAGGAPVAEVHITKLNGKLAIASKIEEVRQVGAAQLANARGVAEGFAVDAWLANWDVVGLAYDNLQVRKDGSALRLDVGGSLDFRAQGKRKGPLFDVTVGELSTLRDPKFNPTAASVFGSLTDEQVLASMRRVAKVSDAAIREIVGRYGYGTAAERKAFASKLVARRKDIARQLADLEEARRPKPRPAATVSVPEPGTWRKAKTLEQRMLREADPSDRRELQSIIDAEASISPVTPGGRTVSSDEADDSAHNFAANLDVKTREAFLAWSNGLYPKMRTSDGGVQAGGSIEALAEDASNFIDITGRPVTPAEYVAARQKLLTIRKAMVSAPRHTGTAYRGLTIGFGASEESRAYLKMVTTEGSLFRSESLSSWTHSISTAINSFSRDEEGGILLRVARSTRGVPMATERLSHFGNGEHEMLIDKGHKYRVVKVSKREGDKHRLLVDLEEVD